MENKSKTSGLVENGYNQIAQAYRLERAKLKTGKYVQRLSELLPKGATVLDVGCGAGVPVDDVLLKRGYLVVGIDIAAEQIKLARKLCKGGDYQVKDMRDLKRGEYQVGAVVCLYTMFHIPRAEHEAMLRNFASYLPLGGYLLLTMGDKDFEGEHLMFGTRMWSSQWGRARNTEMVETAGFEVIVNELNTSGSEQHQVILARKVREF